MTFHQRWLIRDRGASGGQATVYRAWDVRYERDVALKLFTFDVTEDRRDAATFDREVRNLASVDHQNVVRILDHGTQHGRTFIVMSWVRGVTLQKLGRPALEDIACIARDASTALQACHEADVIHGDVTDKNLMAVGHAGNFHTVLLDFGISRRGLTQRTGDPYGGTAGFEAPEVLGRQAKLSPAADQYALAAVVFSLAAGRYAFDGGSRQEIHTQQLEGPAPRLRDVAPAPLTLSDALERALAPEPRDRFPSLVDFVDAAFPREVAPPPTGSTSATETERDPTSEPAPRRSLPTPAKAPPWLPRPAAARDGPKRAEAGVLRRAAARELEVQAGSGVPRRRKLLRTGPRFEWLGGIFGGLRSRLSLASRGLTVVGTAALFSLASATPLGSPRTFALLKTPHVEVRLPPPWKQGAPPDGLRQRGFSDAARTTSTAFVLGVVPAEAIASWNEPVARVRIGPGQALLVDGPRRLHASRTYLAWVGDRYVAAICFRRGAAAVAKVHTECDAAANRMDTVRQPQRPPLPTEEEHVALRRAIRIYEIASRNANAKLKSAKRPLTIGAASQKASRAASRAGSTVDAPQLRRVRATLRRLAKAWRDVQVAADVGRNARYRAALASVAAAERDLVRALDDLPGFAQRERG